MTSFKSRTTLVPAFANTIGPGLFLAADRIIGGAERLDRQLEDVLTLSRAQRLIEPDEQVPLGDVVSDVLHQLEMRINETGAKVEVAEGLPVVWADRPWAVQAVLNLVANALKFAKPGRPPEIAIRGFEHNGALSPMKGLIVADRGPGVPPTLTPRHATTPTSRPNCASCGRWRSSRTWRANRRSTSNRRPPFRRPVRSRRRTRAMRPAPTARRFCRASSATSS